MMADVCLLLEGTYPYVAGGVSTWTHDLVLAQPHLKFHLVVLLAEATPRRPHYRIPDNVTGVTHIVVGRMGPGEAGSRGIPELIGRLESPLARLARRGGLTEIRELIRILAPHRARLGRHVLLNSREAWQLLLRMYRTTHSAIAFLDYFWTWRAIFGGLFSILLAELPRARVYHAASTGYAGLMAARAHLETGRPALLTEHGIYTNERRIEIAMADWLQGPTDSLRIDRPHRDLKDLWVDTFTSYSRACYEAAARILTLYGGNQQFQVQDGADPAKLAIIPNGIDYERYAAVPRDPALRPPTVAFIGRVVPIKDVKTFLRAMTILRRSLPEVEALILGPTDEDPAYFDECRNLVAHLGLGESVHFLGRVKVTDYLGKIDVIALTSVSEAQPLVILEAGAAGVPSVATDVGACREMILGDARESPRLGDGGVVTPLADPAATAEGLRRILAGGEFARTAGRAIRERVRLYYNKPALDAAYGELYQTFRRAPDDAARPAMEAA